MDEQPKSAQDKRILVAIATQQVITELIEEHRQVIKDRVRAKLVTLHVTMPDEGAGE